MAEKVNVQPNIPRICSKQIHRQSVPPDSTRQGVVEYYYLINIAIKFLDNVCVELDERFSNVFTACSCLMYLALLTLYGNFTPNTHEELIVKVNVFEDD